MRRLPELHPNGQVREKYTLKEGKLDGLVSAYSPAGELLHTAQFAQGVLNGEAVTYAPDGVLAQKANFKDGKLEGELVTFVAGKPNMKATYKRGKQEGPTVFLSPAGTVVAKALYIRWKAGRHVILVWPECPGCENILIPRRPFERGNNGVFSQRKAAAKLYI